VDETKRLASNSDLESYSEYATSPPESRSPNPSVSTPPTDLRPEHQILPLGHITVPGPTEQSSHSHPFPPQANSFENRLVSSASDITHEDLPLLSLSNPLTIEGILNKGGSEYVDNSETYHHSGEAQTIPQIYSERPAWPLTDPSEALLLRHFVQNLAIWVRRRKISHVNWSVILY
jgi:hypothetical protein